jgi:hypothetical protein
MKKIIFNYDNNKYITLMYFIFFIFIHIFAYLIEINDRLISMMSLLVSIVTCFYIHNSDNAFIEKYITYYFKFFVLSLLPLIGLAMLLVYFDYPAPAYIDPVMYSMLTIYFYLGKRIEY